MIHIGSLPVGPGHPCRVVAEIGTSHNGDLGLALRLIREAAEAGADAVKFQAYTLGEILALRGEEPVPEPWASQGWTSLRALYERAGTPQAWFPLLATEAEGSGVPWFASVFGPESLDMLLALRCPAYKVAALDRDAELTTLVCDVAGTIGRPVIASAPVLAPEWADLALYCPPGYPQAWEAEPAYLPSGFGGVSYHGTDLALARGMATWPGVHMLEVHVQADDTPSELDWHSSLTVSQLRELCSARVVA